MLKIYQGSEKKKLNLVHRKQHFVFFPSLQHRDWNNPLVRGDGWHTFRILQGIK